MQKGVLGFSLKSDFSRVNTRGKSMLARTITTMFLCFLTGILFFKSVPGAKNKTWKNIFKNRKQKIKMKNIFSDLASGKNFKTIHKKRKSSQ